MLNTFEGFTVENRVESRDKVFGSALDILDIELIISNQLGRDIFNPNRRKLLDNVRVVVDLREASYDDVTSRLPEGSRRGFSQKLLGLVIHEAADKRKESLVDNAG